jgi:hypothetical protein
MAEYAAGENMIKAAFVLNFTKFIEWPATAFKSETDPFTICVVGNDTDLNAEFKKLERKSVGSKKIVISNTASSTCHIIFISGADAGKSKKFIDEAEKSPILTIGNNNSFLSKGGIIYLYTEKSDVLFEINNTVAQKHGIKISSRLLKIARTVE